MHFKGGVSMFKKLFKEFICPLLVASLVITSLSFAAFAAGPVENVLLDKTSVSVFAGDTFSLTASVEPVAADNAKIRFASNNPYLTLSDAAYNPITQTTSVTVETTRNTEGKIIAISDDGDFTAICDVVVGDALEPGAKVNRAAETTGRVLSCSGENSGSGEGVAQAFDNRINTKWLTMTPTGWIQVQFQKRYYITKYSIVSGSSALADQRVPKDWTVSGSNDGSNWDILDQQVNQEFTTPQLKRIYDIDLDKARAYQYYRLNITANNGSATIVELAEFELFECGPAQSWALGPFEKLDEFNPILTANSDTFYCPATPGTIQWTSLSLYNPGAIVKDGEINVLYRAQDNTSRRTSRVGLATSTDGLTFERYHEPIVYPDNTYNNYEWAGGCEDPRVILSTDGTYYMYYTGYNGSTARLMVASSKDLKNWTKHGLTFDRYSNGKYRNTWSKSGSVVSDIVDGVQVARKINGKYWMYWGESNMFMATSEDLINWDPVENPDGSLKWVLGTRRGSFDSNLVEPGPPAIYTDEGILLIYNGKNNSPTSSSNPGDSMILDGAYCPGQVLFDKNDPTVMLDRAPTYFMNPEKSYEVFGLVGKVCFVEGLVFYNDVWYLYYGTADSHLAVAVYDPAKWAAKPKENTVTLDAYDMNFYTGQPQKLSATAILGGGGGGGTPGAEVKFISTNDDIKLTGTNYNPATGETTVQVSASVAAEGMIIAISGDNDDAMICNVTVKEAYSMVTSFKSNGEIITNKDEGDVSFEVTINGNTNLTLDICPIIAVYKNGRLFDVQEAGGAINVAPGQTTVSTPTITLPREGLENYTVKGFLWDSAYRPLAEASVLGEWAPKNPNLALKRPCEASSYAGDGPAFHGNDGSMGTYWTAAQTSSGDIWYTVDLGFDAEIDKVVIRWGSLYVNNFRIETATSAAPGTFTTATTVATSAGGDQTITFAGRTARYVRFYYPSSGTGYRVRIQEFEVYGVPVEPGVIKLVKPYDVDVTYGELISIKADTYGYYGSGITFEVENLPVGAAFDDVDGILTWTPTNAQIGKYSVTFKVSNGVTTDQKTFTINVKPVNLALGKTVTVSSTDSSDHAKEYAVDGDPGTRWASSSQNNQTIAVDLGAEYSISRVVLSWEAAYGRTYRIEYATAAAPNTWLTATTNDNGVGGIEELTFSPVTARHIRMYGLTRATSWGFSLWEFEIYEQ